MAKGKLNTPWNRFWLLVSVLWIGVCWYGASTVNIPPDYDKLGQQHGGTPAGVDYDRLAQKARQDSFVPDSTTLKSPPGATLVPAPIAALQALAEKYGATVETAPQRHPEVKGDIFDQLAAADRVSPPTLSESEPSTLANF